MVAKVFEQIEAAAPRFSGNARTAIEYGMFQKVIMDRAKGAPDYSPDEWLGLKQFVTDDFQRIGTFREVMTLDEMVRFLQAWSPTAQWEGSFKRLTEHDNVVFLELEERVDDNPPVNTVSVYEFDDAGKLRHLDVYIQAAPGSVEKGEAYDA